MSGMGGWDVWLLGFEPGADPIRGLVDLFGMTEEAAQHIEMTLPRAMKRKLTQEDAQNMLAALQRIGAKAELREHRVESARRSVSRPQMEAVRESAPTLMATAASPAATPGPPPAGPASSPQPALASPTPGTPAETGRASTPGTPIQIPLGTPVGAELSKTPRNIFLVIVGLLAVVTAVGIAMSFRSGEGPQGELGPVDTEARAMLEGASMDVGAFLNNPTAGFSGNERSTITPFVDACYAAGAKRLVVADIRDVGGATFAHALLVELPDTDPGKEAIHQAEATILASHASGTEMGDHWMIVRFDR